MAKQNHVVALHVGIDGIRPAIWRRIAVDSEITLRALHHVLQAAFGHRFDRYADKCNV